MSLSNGWGALVRLAAAQGQTGGKQTGFVLCPEAAVQRPAVHTMSSRAHLPFDTAPMGAARHTGGPAGTPRDCGTPCRAAAAPDKGGTGWLAAHCACNSKPEVCAGVQRPSPAACHVAHLSLLRRWRVQPMLRWMQWRRAARSGPPACGGSSLRPTTGSGCRWCAVRSWRAATAARSSPLAGAWLEQPQVPLQQTSQGKLAKAGMPGCSAILVI